jgi:hypothetical protein
MGGQAMEVWKDIVGYEGMYQVSNYGNVKSLERVVVRSNGSKMYIKEKLLNKRLNDRGYIEIKLSKNGKSGYAKLHRLVAQAFIPNPENKPQVNHKDTDKENNHVDNLEWNTHSENQKHAHANGLYDRSGEANSCNKVSEQDVIEIRTRKASGEKLGKVYESYKESISKHGFKAIWYGYNWKHIKI